MRRIYWVFIVFEIIAPLSLWTTQTARADSPGPMETEVAQTFHRAYQELKISCRTSESVSRLKEAVSKAVKAQVDAYSNQRGPDFNGDENMHGLSNLSDPDEPAFDPESVPKEIEFKTSPAKGSK